MLCSDCKKNNAVVFVNKKGDDGKNTLEGYCYDCAKKRGINPIDSLIKQANLSEEDLNNMTEQFESMFKDMSDNMNFSDIQEDSNDSYNADEPSNAIQFGAIPLGSIFSNMFGTNQTEENNNSSSTSKKKVKVDKKANKKKKTLETFGTNLTQKAKNNELDAVIGRDKEIQRMIQILNRRSKNNPCLIGEPGVGKTAVVEGLAQKIVAGDVPEILKNKRVVSLDMASMIAGAKYRGDFEERIKKALKEVQKAGDIIIFIDEIESALHPSAVCQFLDMINNIATNMDMQFFISSHSYFVIKKLALIAMNTPGLVTCISLHKAAPPEVHDLYDGMPNNSIIDAAIRLYEQEIREGL